MIDAVNVVSLVSSNFRFGDLFVRGCVWKMVEDLTMHSEESMVTAASGHGL